MNYLRFYGLNHAVSSCECERSFSSLRRPKIYVKHSMAQERLSGISLLNIKKDFEINAEQILTDFIAKKVMF